MKNKFFTFLDPVLNLIDNGWFFRAPFQWLYTILAALNLLVPILVLYAAIDKRIFSAPAKLICAFLLIFVIVCGLSWFGFQIWWNRRDRIVLSSKDNDEFVAIPAYAHFIQTSGEWIGMYVGVGGCLFTLMLTLFLGNEIGIARMIGIDGIVGSSPISCILFPIYGFLIIVVTRVLAEVIRALASIANNTRK